MTNGKTISRGSASDPLSYLTHQVIKLAHLSSFLGLILLGCTPSSDSNPLIVEGQTMGTTYVVKCFGSPSKGKELVGKLVAEVLEDINQKMSTYLPSSELSRFNQSSQTSWFPVSHDTVKVVEKSLEIGKLSSGALDITIGPLVNLWGFGAQKGRTDPPSPEEVTKVKEQIGAHFLHYRTSPPALKKDIPSLQVDLSAVAKGYAVDKVAKALESLKIENYMVEVGGEIKTKGTKLGRQPWTMAIETPTADMRGIYEVIHLKDMGLATSGDYRNYFEKNGQRYSHTLDPSTGSPITHELASVSVLHEDCMTADALATALNVLGPVKGMELAVNENIMAFFIIKKRRQEGFEERSSPAWTKYVKMSMEQENKKGH